MADVPILNLPQIRPGSESMLRGQQIGLASLQREDLQQNIQQKQQKQAQSQALNALKQKGLTDPRARAIAIQLDPNYGQQLQEFEAQQQEFEAKRAIYWGGQAQAASSAPLAQRPSYYKSIYDKAKTAGEDVSIYPLPSEKWTDAHQGALEFISKSSVPAKDALEAKQKQQAAESKLKRGLSLPSDVRSYQFYKDLPPQEQQDFLNVKRDVLKTGLTTDEQGKVVVLPGITQAKTDIKASESKGTAIGKTQAEIKASLASQESKIPELEKAVKDLSTLSKKATYTKAGQLRDDFLRQSGLPISEGGIARAEYAARVDNQILPLLRDTFGAQFTEREGATLRATLGDVNKAPAEKNAILRAFIKQKKATIQSTKRQLGISNGSSSASQYQEGQTATNPKTGQTLTFTGGKWQ